MLNIFGWYDSRDLSPALSLADYTEDRAMADVRAFADSFNAEVERLEGDLAVRTTLAKSSFGLGVGGEMQPYGEAGVVEATRTPAAWDVAYPIYAFRSRKLYTDEYLADVTLEQLEKDVIASAVENFETRRKMIFRALMKKTNFTFDDGSAREFPKNGLGSLAVKRLVNNDSAAGEVWVNGAAVAIAALQHYIGSNNATMVQAAYETAYAKLKNVGLAQDVVFRVNPNDEATVRGFTDFVPSQSTLIVDPTAPFARVQSPRAIGRIEGDAVSGEVVLEPLMPSGYFFGNNRAGGDEMRPVVIREHPLPQYRGWNLIQDQTRMSYGEQSLHNKIWQYIAGAGVRNRVNGVAVQIVASTTYTDPTI